MNLSTLPDPSSFSPPDDPDFNVSQQPLGDASVLVDYVIEDGSVTVQGAWVQGELVDEIEFARHRVECWRDAIQLEYDQEREGAES